MHNRLRQQCGILAACSLLAIVNPAAAETSVDPDPELQEVIVVATKRETKEQETPIALTVLSSAALEAANVNNLSEVALFTPGLFVGADNGFGATTMAIRGLGPLNLSIGGDEAVGVYIDDVYQSTPYGNVFDFIDVDQIEVLRGPQGTLYGRNATGGAIVINSLRPGPDAVLKGDIGAGELNSFEGRAIVGGPIAGDGLFGQVAVGKSSHEGWAINPLDGTKLDGDTNLMASAALRWYPGGVWDVIGRFRYGNDDNTNAQKNPLDSTPLQDIPATFPNGSRRDFGAATLNATATWPGATFSSTTGYTNARTQTLSSSANVGLTEFRDRNDANEWYQELRAGSNGDHPLSWLAGVNAVRENAIDDVDYTLTAKLLGTAAGDGLVFDNTLKSTSIAEFLELGWKITDRLHVTAGTRYTHDKKDWGNCVVAGGYTSIYVDYSPTLCTGKYNPESRSWNASTPRFIADYRFTDTVYSYASVTRGFRSGGWNFTTAVNPAEPYSTTFNPEFDTSYEIGLKSEFLDRRLRANAAVYLANITSLQVRTVDPIYHLTEVRNAGAARTKGVELQVLGKPLPDLTVSSNATWQLAKYTRFSYLDTNGALDDYAGHFLDNAPEWQYGISADYALRLPGGASLTPRIDANYVSRVFYNEQNVYPYDASGHATINLLLRYTVAAGNWGGFIYVNNAGDVQSRLYVNGTATAQAAYYALPRIIGVRLFWNAR